MVKAGNNETFNVNLPKSFILKKIKDGYYLYDEEKKIGFFVIEDLRASQSYDKR